MRAVIQRVKNASVTIDNKLHSEIGMGMMVLLGIEESDTIEDIEWLCGKMLRLRIFDDRQGVMNLPLNEIDGQLLIISQFTLHASTKKGNRPSYIKSARPEIAIPLYEKCIETLEVMSGKKIFTGKFGANMQVSLINDGPVTIIIDSKNRE